MTRFSRLFLFGFVSLFWCSCQPEERFAWSPDGNYAAVIINDQLHLADATGRLVAARHNEAGKEEENDVRKVEWLPDGGGLVMHEIKVFRDWNILRDQLPEEEVKAVEALTVNMPQRIESAAILLGSDAELGDLISRLSLESKVVNLSAFQLACSLDRAAIEVALKDSPSARAQLEKIDEGSPGFPVHEISIELLDPDRTRFVESRPVLRSLRGIQGLALAPDGKSVAVEWQTEHPERFDLEIVGLANGSRREIAKGITSAFAWSPDGESLVFLESLSAQGGHLMRLMWQSLKAAGDAETRSLATVLIPFAPRVVVLPDNSVLFAGQPIILPASGRDPERQPRLFLLSLPDAEIREVFTPPGSLPMDLGSFVPSPDGSKVAIVESGSDAVAIVNLETGSSELLGDSHPGWKCRTLPAWRTSNALTYAVLAKNGEQIDWILREEDGETHRLSAAWPKGATSGWLEWRQGNDPTP
ncbi:MAG: PD40 domain-containing protein [Verrucomicrobiae bacterium]|nr:PD40 domain-containing protein [Verrucomicrobiae bacterium]MCB1085463.1 PD40 domain-containing protein [Verrucomicrobiae bacterium]